MLTKVRANIDTSYEIGSLPLYIDSSTLTTFRACRHKYFNSTIQALYPYGRSIHLVAGAAFASGLEAARRLVFSYESSPEVLTIDDMLRAAFPPFCEEWGDTDLAFGESKSFSNVFSALDEYLQEYDPRTDVLQPLLRADGTPAIEFTFAIPLDDCVPHPSGEPFIFVGRFDMLGEYRADDNLRFPCGVDEKTTGSIGYNWASQWDLRGQYIGYIWALRQLGHPIRTMVTRGIGLYKTEFRFQTAITEYPDYIIDRWYTQLNVDLSELTTKYEVWKRTGDPGVWSYNFGDSCSSYGGCAFAQLCSSKRPEDFYSNFIRHRWNPLEKKPLKEIAS